MSSSLCGSVVFLAVFFVWFVGWLICLVCFFLVLIWLGLIRLDLVWFVEFVLLVGWMVGCWVVFVFWMVIC